MTLLRTLHLFETKGIQMAFQTDGKKRQMKKNFMKYHSKIEPTDYVNGKWRARDIIGPIVS